MKKAYQSPDLSVLLFSTEEVLTASVPDPTSSSRSDVVHHDNTVDKDPVVLPGFDIFG